MTDGQLSLLDVPVGPGVSQCVMTACRGAVKCPDDAEVRACTCCGAAPGQEQS